MQNLETKVEAVSRGGEGVISVQGAAPVGAGELRPLLRRNVADKLEGVQGGP